MRVLFYGGKWHGSVRVMERLLETHVVKFGQRAIASPLQSPYVEFQTDIYRPMMIRDSTYSYHNGMMREEAAVMVCQGKTYNHRKVWRMMKRYKALPMHRVWVDSDPYSLV